MFGLNGISTLEAPHSAIAKSVQRLNVKVISSQGRDRHADDLGRHIQTFDPGSGIMADPECTADVGERDGRHLVVKFGRHSSDEDTAEAKQGLDIHRVC
jgi:hypothetical protein